MKWKVFVSCDSRGGSRILNYPSWRIVLPQSSRSIKKESHLWSAARGPRASESCKHAARASWFTSTFGRQPPAAVAAAISLSACLRMPALPRHPSSLGSPIITDDKKGGGNHLTGTFPQTHATNLGGNSSSPVSSISCQMIHIKVTHWASMVKIQWKHSHY